MERRILRDVLVVEGEVAVRRTVAVKAPDSVESGGRLIVTSAPPRLGTRLSHGSLLGAVSGHPMFLLYGDVPLYRDIVAGAVGPDVEVLQSGLERAGYSIYDTAGVYGPSTQAAVTHLWESHGFEPVTQEVEIESAEGTKKGAQTVETPVAVWRSFVVTNAIPSVVVSRGVRLGDEVQPGDTVLSLSNALPVITLKATTAQAGEIRSGLHVRYAVGNRAGRGSVTSIRRSAQGDLVEVVVEPGSPLSYERLGDRVAADIELSSSRREVLAVPLTAVRTDSAGRDVLVRVVRSGAREPTRESVSVTLGPVIGGWVAIKDSQPSLVPGDEVLVGSEIP